LSSQRTLLLAALRQQRTVSSRPYQGCVVVGRCANCRGAGHREAKAIVVGRAGRRGPYREAKAIGDGRAGRCGPDRVAKASVASHANFRGPGCEEEAIGLDLAADHGCHGHDRGLDRSRHRRFHCHRDALALVALCVVSGCASGSVRGAFFRSGRETESESESGFGFGESGCGSGCGFGFGSDCGCGCGCDCDCDCGAGSAYCHHRIRGAAEQSRALASLG